MTKRERCARVMCIAEGVDSERECVGLGNHIPEGETWPAWKVRLKYVDAIFAELAELDEAMLYAGKETVAEAANRKVNIHGRMKQCFPKAQNVWQAMLRAAAGGGDG